MPLYNYVCPTCGPFDDWRPLSQAEADAACPGCAAPSHRSVAMPFLARVSRETRIAHQRNEQSAEQPRVMGPEELNRLGQARSHGHAHGRSMYSSVLGHAH
jgi:putative FmdB family regulatory protein